MKLTRKQTAIILISIGGLSLLGGTTTIIALNAVELKISLLQSGYEGQMSSILIETGGKCIYIDPHLIDDKFVNKKADLIFITHPHADHYDQATIDRIKQDSTIFVVPASCADIMDANNITHEIIGVSPNDTGVIDDINYEVIPAYNIGAPNMGHLKSYNWCGYIFTIGEYTILQTGDTSFIPEYASFADQIDVAILPVGWACSNLAVEGSMQFVDTVNPAHVIPIHYGTHLESYDEFLEGCSTDHPEVKIHETQLYLF